MHRLQNWLKGSQFGNILIGIVIIVTTILIYLILMFIVTSSKVTPSIAESSDTINYRVVSDLNTGYCLVEIIQIYECENPLPVGAGTLYLKVPHIIRMMDCEVRSLK